MNELVKILNKINQEAFIFVKKQEYKIKALKHKRKIDALMKEVYEMERTFVVEGRDDVNTLYSGVLMKEECLTVTDLTRYLRQEYKDKFPDTIDVFEEGYQHTFSLINITDKYVELPYCTSINNGYGKYYTYVSRRFEVDTPLREMMPAIEDMKRYAKKGLEEERAKRRETK